MDLDLWTGQDGAVETYRAASIKLTGLKVFISEPPDDHYISITGAGLTIDIGNAATLVRPPALPLPTNDELTFVNWIYVRQWNSFMYVAAEESTLRW